MATVDNRTIKLLPKSVLWVGLVQTVFLAVGFWVFGRLVLASAEWNARARIQAHEQIDAADADALQIDVEDLTSGDLVNAMRPAMSIVFVWICGLHFMVVYLALTRMNREQVRRESRTLVASRQHVSSLLRTRDAVIFGLAKLAESRDPDTGLHLERIAMYSTRLATEMRFHPRFRREVTPEFVRTIGVSSALHDIGKVGVEDAILLKPDALTTQERASMQQHARLGGNCIRKIEQRLGNSNFLEMARKIAFSHHEHWDGKGYPRGLSGSDIPLSARIVAIADVYDALTSRRVYKDPMSHSDCIEVIRNESGQQFDPEVVAVFLSIDADFRKISAEFSDALAARRAETSVGESPLLETPPLNDVQEELLVNIMKT
ncbi:MAG: HD domain-containing phosphohydrolase [Planctomycetaceae bacterium]